MDLMSREPHTKGGAVPAPLVAAETECAGGLRGTAASARSKGWSLCEQGVTKSRALQV